MTWIKTTAKFIPHDISEEEWECYNEQAQKDAEEKRKFRFDTDEMQVYNESYDGNVSIRMKNGYEITINMTVEELDKIMGV